MNVGVLRALGRERTRSCEEQCPRLTGTVPTPSGCRGSWGSERLVGGAGLTHLVHPANSGWGWEVTPSGTLGGWGRSQQRPPRMQAHQDRGAQQGPATLGYNTGLQGVLGLRTEVPDSDKPGFRSWLCH